MRLPARLVLEKHGYSVLCARNGEEAVEVFKEHKDKIDLVIMDLLMPKLGGRQAWRRISKLRPATNVIFISGYNVETAGKAPAKSEAVLLSKPFSMMQLLKSVRALLDQPPAAANA